MSEQKVEETTIKEEKPYKFKELDFDCIFPAMTLINKIGLEKVLGLMENKSIMNLVQGKKPFKVDKNGNTLFETVTDDDGNEKQVEIIDNEAYISEIGKAVVSMTQLLFSCLGNCKNELYAVLSSASNLSVEEIGKLKLKFVSSMIMDFIKLDDFKDFFSGLLKSMKN